MATSRNLFLTVIFIIGFLPRAAAAASGIEVTPFGGFRFGGSFQDANTGDSIAIDEAGSYGLMLDFDTEPSKQIEIYLSRQNSKLSSGGTVTGNPKFDLTVDYYHIGGLLMLDGERTRPFISGTFGLTRMDPHGADRSTEYYPSIALGGGAKIPLTERLGLRFDARGIFTLVNNNSTVFCANGGCAIRVEGSGILQGELTVGLTFKF